MRTMMQLYTLTQRHRHEQRSTFDSLIPPVTTRTGNRQGISCRISSRSGFFFITKPNTVGGDSTNELCISIDNETDDRWSLERRRQLMGCSLFFPIQFDAMRQAGRQTNNSNDATGEKVRRFIIPQKKCQLGMWLQRRRSVVSVFVVVVIIIINGRRCCVTRLDGRTDGRANGNAIGAPPHSFVDLDLQLMITSYHNKTPPNRLYCTSVAVKGNCNCIFVLNCALPLLWCACV